LLFKPALLFLGVCRVLRVGELSVLRGAHPSCDRADFLHVGLSCWVLQVCIAPLFPEAAQREASLWILSVTNFYHEKGCIQDGPAKNTVRQLSLDHKCPSGLLFE